MMLLDLSESLLELVCYSSRSAHSRLLAPFLTYCATFTPLLNFFGWLALGMSDCFVTFLTLWLSMELLRRRR